MSQQNERGRGKKKPDATLKVEQVRAVLMEKIAEEMERNKSMTETTEWSDGPTDKCNVLSLFCGAGGLDLGFELAGLETVIGEQEALKAFRDRETYEGLREKSVFHGLYANDIFTEALGTYRRNMPNHVTIHQQDIRKINTFPKANLVVGGFPCPGFSEAGPRLIDDERNFLYIHFIRCLMDAKPEVFVAENVKGMLTLGKGEVFRQIVEDFSAAGYTVYHKLVNAREYGVPQLRERVILVGVRNDLDFTYKFPEPTHGMEKGQLPYVTLQEAIGDLAKEPGPYFTGSYSSMYMSRNRKKKWDEQSFTIQASGRQAPLHPGGMPMEHVGRDKWIFPDGEEKHRRLSVAEIKRIQTFPDWYVFEDGGNLASSENNRLNKIYKQVGNAVPVLLARAIAKPIAVWMKENIKPSDSSR